ncbi:MAG: sigma-70 family RNA polymerase sigma factor [Planctomycetota bacterium]
MSAGAEHSPDERSLVEALIRNDAAAWDVFVARYEPLVLGVARRTLRESGASDADGLARDVANDVFAELLADDRKALRRFREPWSFKGWLGVVAARRARRTLRATWRHPEELPAAVSARGRTPGSELGQIEEADKVRESLDALKPVDRLVLQLFYEGEHSYKEIAAMTGRSVSGVGMVLTRARERLGRLLAREA